MLSIIPDHLNENCCKLGLGMGTFIKSFPSDSKEQQVCEPFALVCLLRWQGNQAILCLKSLPVPNFYHSVHLAICGFLSPFTGEDAEILVVTMTSLKPSKAHDHRVTESEWGLGFC